MPPYFYCHEGIMEKKILVLFLCAIICFSGCDKKEKSETKKISGNITIGQLDSKDVYEKKAIQWDMTNMVSYGDEAVVELEDGYIKYRDPKQQIPYMPVAKTIVNIMIPSVRRILKKAVKVLLFMKVICMFL